MRLYLAQTYESKLGQKALRLRLITSPIITKKLPQCLSYNTGQKVKVLIILDFAVALCGTIVALSGTIWRSKIRTKSQNYHNLGFCCGTMWYYVALSGTIWQSNIWTKSQNSHNLGYCCGTMWHYVALSGTIWQSKIRTKSQNLHNLGFCCGTMWHYVALSGTIWRSKIRTKSLKFA